MFSGITAVEQRRYAAGMMHTQGGQSHTVRLLFFIMMLLNT